MLKHLKSSDEWTEKSLGAKGFTLIELLVVIVILGILAAVVVFAVGGIQDRGKDSACKTDARTLRTSVEAYRAKYDTATNPTEAQLVSERLLSELSTNYNISYTGNTLEFTAQAGGKCV